MMARLRISLTCFGFLAWVVVAQDDNAAAMQKIIDRAIEAHGGEEIIAKFKGTQVKFKGKFFATGEGVDYTGELAYQIPDRFRFGIEFEVQGMRFNVLQVVSGNKGWAKILTDVKELDKDQYAEADQGLHVVRVTNLLALRDKNFKLSPLGESKVGGKAMNGIRVSAKDRRDVNLFFDKESGLLTKVETVVRDPMAGNQEFTQATVYEEFKKVQGKLVPMKLSIYRNSKLFVNGVNTEVRLAEKLDDNLFARP